MGKQEQEAKKRDQHILQRERRGMAFAEACTRSALVYDSRQLRRENRAMMRADQSSRKMRLHLLPGYKENRELDAMCMEERLSRRYAKLRKSICRCLQKWGAWER